MLNDVQAVAGAESSAIDRGVWLNGKTLADFEDKEGRALLDCCGRSGLFIADGRS